MSKKKAYKMTVCNKQIEKPRPKVKNTYEFI